MEKQNAVYRSRGAIISLETEGESDTCCGMDGPGGQRTEEERPAANGQLPYGEGTYVRPPEESHSEEVTATSSRQT